MRHYQRILLNLSFSDFVPRKVHSWQRYEKFLKPITYEFPISSALTIFDVDNDNDLEIFGGTTNSLLMLDIKTIGSIENNWNIYCGDNKRSSFYNIVCISGDLNLSETLDILDIILLVDEILEISEDEYLNCQVDLNNDNNINIFDLILLVYAILDE